jgi:hypothetical protein
MIGSSIFRQVALENTPDLLLSPFLLEAPDPEDPTSHFAFFDREIRSLRENFETVSTFGEKNEFVMRELADCYIAFGPADRSEIRRFVRNTGIWQQIFRLWIPSVRHLVDDPKTFYRYYLAGYSIIEGEGESSDVRTCLATLWNYSDRYSPEVSFAFPRAKRWGGQLGAYVYELEDRHLRAVYAEENVWAALRIRRELPQGYFA